MALGETTTTDKYNGHGVTSCPFSRCGPISANSEVTKHRPRYFRFAAPKASYVFAWFLRIEPFLRAKPRLPEESAAAPVSERIRGLYLLPTGPFGQVTRSWQREAGSGQHQVARRQSYSA